MILFVPASEKLNPTEHTLYFANFRLGFFGFQLILIDSDDRVDRWVREKLIEMGKPQLAKRYICLLGIGTTHWLWYSSDNITEAELHWKKVLSDLKKGEEVIFEDCGEPKNRSVRLSWHGLDIEW